MTKKKKILLAVCAAVLVALVIWVVWSNVALVVTRYTVSDPELPAAFAGFRIAHISDLHNDWMGKPGGKLLTQLVTAQPDIIVLTGDLVDSRRTDIPAALAFAAEAVKIAPCYYAPGNHESRIPEYETLKKGLADLGVVVLENEKVELRRGDETVTLMGVLDPTFATDYVKERAAQIMDENLQSIPKPEGFSILLAHQPELIEIYAKHSVDLVLSGHVHGGQARLPFVGAIYAPSQGLFPKYDAGLFEEGDTRMIISRGIGNSVIPLRFNNPPELVLITLTNNP